MPVEARGQVVGVSSVLHHMGPGVGVRLSGKSFITELSRQPFLGFGGTVFSHVALVGPKLNM